MAPYESTTTRDSRVSAGYPCVTALPTRLPHEPTQELIYNRTDWPTTFLPAIVNPPGISVPLATLLESLPGLLALLADEALGARLARDSWVMPPVLLPLLVQITPPSNQA